MSMSLVSDDLGIDRGESLGRAQHAVRGRSRSSSDRLHFRPFETVAIGRATDEILRTESEVLGLNGHERKNLPPPRRPVPPAVAKVEIGLAPRWLLTVVGLSNPCLVQVSR